VSAMKSRIRFSSRESFFSTIDESSTMDLSDRKSAIRSLSYRAYLAYQGIDPRTVRWEELTVWVSCSVWSSFLLLLWISPWMTSITFFIQRRDSIIFG
jgi:hypothetical protein